MASNDYHSIDRMSQSKLKLLWDDPALFAEIYIHKTRSQPAPTPAMQFGIDTEEFLLRGFENVAIVPEEVLQVDKNGRKSKAGAPYKQWLASTFEGARVMRYVEYKEFIEPFESIKRNIESCPTVRDLVFGGAHKVPIMWRYLDVDMKSEIDVLHDHCIVDLKTCADVEGEAFSRQCVNLGYQIQAAAYQLAVEQHTGKLLPFWFVAILNKPSYRVEVYQLDDDFMQSGRQELGDMIEFYKECLSRNEWRSETWGQLNIIKIPKWYEKQQQEWSLA